MYKTISKSIKLPLWAQDSPRWKRLYLLDLWLDGEFYDHLAFSFYEETQGENYIPIIERRPSVQFNLPRHIATSIARKLFGGRHIPRFVHSEEDNTVISQLNEIATETGLWKTMLQAAIWGTVGSVAITFRVNKQSEGKGKLVFDTWRAKDCWPRFDKFGELALLRVARTVTSEDFQMLSYPEPLDVNAHKTTWKSGKLYWFVRDYSPSKEITYQPMEEEAWHPNCPELDVKMLKEDTDRVISHDLGFVPGHWFTNLSGGKFPDGASTWEPCLNIAIEGDYTMSQLGRGIRYTAAPQLVIEGNLENWNYGGPNGATVVKSPAHMLKFAETTKDAMGATEGGGKAYLLETHGEGIKAGLQYFEWLRKLALEQISAQRKDPDKFRVPQSGKAMEILDDDWNDLVQEHRVSYGDEGLLPMMRKAVITGKKKGLFKELDDSVVIETQLQWPKVFQPSVADLQTFAQAAQILVKSPGVQAAQPATAATNGNGAKPGAAKGPVGLDLLSKEEARSVLETLIDIPPKPQKPAAAVAQVANPEEPEEDVPQGTVAGSEPGGGAEDAVRAGTAMSNAV